MLEGCREEDVKAEGVRWEKRVGLYYRSTASSA